MALLHQELRRRCVWAHKRDNLLSFAPPLVVPQDDVEEALSRVGAAMDVVFMTEGALGQ